MKIVNAIGKGFVKVKQKFTHTVYFGTIEAEKYRKMGNFELAIEAINPVVEKYPKNKGLQEYVQALLVDKAEKDIEYVEEILCCSSRTEGQFIECFNLITSAMKILGKTSVKTRSFYNDLLSKFPTFLKLRLESGDDLKNYANCIIGHEILSSYKVEKYVDKGSAGIIFLCKHNISNEMRAIKLIPCGDKDKVSIEANLQSKLNKSDKVPSIYQIERIGDDFYIVMEYIEGQNLRKFMTRNKIDKFKAAKIGVKICGAIEELHAMGIFHHDIKPENIMIDSNEGVIITDFGLAYLVGDDKKYHWGGTKPYVAPEIRSLSMKDHRSDIYSLGVVLWEITGNAFPIPNEMESATEGQRFSYICRKASVENADDRFQSMKEMKESLLGYIHSINLNRGSQRPIENKVGVLDADIFEDNLIEVPGGKVMYLNGLEFNIDGYYIDKKPITYGQFSKFIGVMTPVSNNKEIKKEILIKIWTKNGFEFMKDNPSELYSKRELDVKWDKPVNNVSWYVAIAFCNWRTIMVHNPELLFDKSIRKIIRDFEEILSYDEDGQIKLPQKRSFRLPTEFELEKAKPVLANIMKHGKSLHDYHELTTSSYLRLEHLNRYQTKKGKIPYIKGKSILAVNWRRNRSEIRLPKLIPSLKTVFRCVSPMPRMER